MTIEEFSNDFFIARYPNANFSKYFLQQMYDFHFGRVLDTWKILAEIDYLEGKRSQTPTKIEREFKRNPALKGIWYKHFFSGYFMKKNLMNHLSKEKMAYYVKDALDKSYGLEDQDEIYNSILSYNLTIRAFEERNAQKMMTGEWIIYKPLENKRLYIMIAEHGNDSLIEDVVRQVTGQE